MRRAERQSLSRHSSPFNVILPKSGCLVIRCDLSGVYGSLGRYEEALEFSRQALAIDPNYAEACYNLDISLFKLGRGKDANAVLRTLEQINQPLAMKLKNRIAGLR